MKLYDWKNSYNSKKIRAVAFESDIKLDLVEMNLRAGDHKKPEYLAKNPNGKVPTLDDNGFYVWESDAICLYIAGLDTARRLLPTNPRARAHIDQWLSWKTAHLAPAIGKVGHERFWKGVFNLGPCDESVVAAAMPEVIRFIDVLDAQLAKSAYVAGDLSVADFSLATVFSNRNEIKLDISNWPNVRAWLERIENRPSWKQTATW